MDVAEPGAVIVGDPHSEVADPTRAIPNAIADLAAELLAAALATRRSEALLVRLQASLLAWLAIGDRAQECGFSSVSALALELHGLKPRTVRERLALHRLFVRLPALEAAFVEGGLSACQILAASAIFKSIDPTDAESVARWIEIASRTSVRSLRYEVRTNPAWQTSAADAGTDTEGTTISFTAPLAFQGAFDSMMELARKVLGFDAPVHECIAAILAETNWAGIGARPRDPEWSAPPRGIDIRPESAVPVYPKAIEHARETLRETLEYIQDVHDLIEKGEPRSPRDAVVSLVQLQRLRAPQRVLFAHLIRDLRATCAMDLLGYRNMAEMVEDRLDLSERSARNRVAESLLFETNEAIEAAYGRGEISLMQAHLIRRFARGARADLFIDRATQLTWRQLQREARLFALLRKCSLGRLTLRPLGQAEIEETLIESLGGDREAIEAKLRERGIAPLPEDGSTDPAENAIRMERLEALAELIALTQWDALPDGAKPDPRQTSAAHAHVTIRFWAPKATAEDLTTVIERFRRKAKPGLPIWGALVVLFAQAEQQWLQEDPERRPVRAKILKRDRYRCVVPVCRNRDHLEDHHLKYRSRGGGDEDENRTTLCHAHHRHGVHRGYIKITGKAPHALRFEIGCRPGKPPLLTLVGSRIVSNALTKCDSLKDAS